MARKYHKLLNKKWWMYVGLVVLIVGAAFLAHWAKDLGAKKSNETIAQAKGKTRIDYTPATKADNATNEARKGAPDSSSTLDSSDSPQNNGTFSVTINRAGLDSTKQNLQIATLINGVSSGTCTARVTQSGQTTITKTEDIMLQVNHYVCPVINISLSQFPNKDKWDVSMTVSSNGKTVTSNWSANPVSLTN